MGKHSAPPSPRRLRSSTGVAALAVAATLAALTFRSLLSAPGPSATHVAAAVSTQASPTPSSAPSPPSAAVQPTPRRTPTNTHRVKRRRHPDASQLPPKESASTLPLFESDVRVDERQVRQAAALAQNRGYRAGVAVLDRKTGNILRGGDATGEFASESVMKTFIATRLLVEGRMTGSTAEQARIMIEESDDGDASALYPRVGADDIEPWIAQHYDVPDLGAASPRPAWWGSTRITPVGLVEFYAKVAADPAVAPWLLQAMHDTTPRASDGTKQYFGLRSASTTAATKQGWGCNFTPDCASEADANSTGYVAGDRYAIALLLRGPHSSYLGPISHTLTDMAKVLLPNG